MRSLDDVTLEKLLPRSDWAEVKVVSLQGAGLSNCETEGPSPFHEVVIANLTNNSIQVEGLSSIWKTFPSVWWVDISDNPITSLSVADFPAALGYLSLHHNEIDLSDLRYLSSMHLMRLVFNEDLEEKDFYRAIALLPLTWCINDQFISWQDRIKAKSLAEGEVVHTMPTRWKPPRDGPEHQFLLRLQQGLSTQDSSSDHQKLDALLEEFIQYSDLYNASIASTRKVGKSISVVRDLHFFLLLPHRQRLDLSVVLAVSVAFDIPENVFREAVALILTEGGGPVGDILALPMLPRFARTAISCLLTRISRQEQRELQCYGSLRRKVIERYDNSQPLKSLHNYLNMAIAPGAPPKDALPSSESMIFTDLELEILSKIPDAPTRLTALHNPMWASFAARHTIFLLNKCPSCPSLTRAPKSASEQETYWALLPLLKAAEMTLSDLDLRKWGPDKDGRKIMNISKALNLQKDGRKSKRKEKVAQALSILASSTNNSSSPFVYVPFGYGLPNASVKSLRWTAEDYECRREYPRPWDLSMQVPVDVEDPQQSEAVIEIEKGTIEENPVDQPIEPSNNFFLTTTNEASIARSPSRRLSVESVAPISSSVGMVSVFRLDESTLSAPVSPRADVPASYQSPKNKMSPSSLSHPDSFPAVFRPHSFSPSGSKLHMIHSPPHSPKAMSSHRLPTVTLEISVRVRSSPQDGHLSEGERDGDENIAYTSRSFVSILLPSTDQEHVPKNALVPISEEDASALNLTPAATARSQASPHASASELIVEPTTQAVEPLKLLPPLEPGELRGKLLASEDSASKSNDEGDASPDLNKLASSLVHNESDQIPPSPMPNPSDQVDNNLLPVKSVEGFSADLLWKPQFLLAPPQSVSAFNESFRGLKATGSLEGDLTNYWRKLDTPPTLVMENSPYGKRLEKRYNQIASNMVNTSVREEECSVEVRKNDHEHLFDKANSLPMPNHHKDEDTDHFSMDDSIETTENQKMPPGASAPPLLQPISEGPSRYDSTEGPVDNLESAKSNNKTKSASKSLHSQPFDEHQALESNLQLMRSLGTLRNVRALEKFNKRVKNKAKGFLLSPSLTALGRVIPDKYLNNIPLGDTNTSTSGLRPKVLHDNQREYQRPSSNGESDVFLTGTGAEEANEWENGEEEGHGGETKEADDADEIDSLSLYSLGSAGHAIQQGHSKRWSPPKTVFRMSQAETMRTTSGYEHIYTVHDWEASGEKAVNGVSLNGTFYPVFPKQLYQIDPALSTVSCQNLSQRMNCLNTTGCCVDGSPKRSRSPKMNNSRSLPLLVPKPMANNETIPAAHHSPRVSRNLQLLQTNPFLKQLVFPQAKQKKTNAKHQDEDSVVSSTAGEPTKLIYEAYQTHVLSASADSESPSLAAIDRPLTHSQKNFQRKNSIPEPHAAGFPTNPYSSATPDVSVSGVSAKKEESICLFRHKAASHKLSLNRAFRMKLPTLQKLSVTDLALENDLSNHVSKNDGK